MKDAISGNNCATVSAAGLAPLGPARRRAQPWLKLPARAASVGLAFLLLAGCQSLLDQSYEAEIAPS
ncbi:MAG: hypothetical protein RLZZ444_3673, partial [Pseudomonadota bacterium]